jgi:hypothetical protein
VRFEVVLFTLASTVLYKIDVYVYQCASKWYDIKIMKIVATGDIIFPYFTYHVEKF